MAEPSAQPKQDELYTCIKLLKKLIKGIFFLKKETFDLEMPPLRMWFLNHHNETDSRRWKEFNRFISNQSSQRQTWPTDMILEDFPV